MAIQSGQVNANLIAAGPRAIPIDTGGAQVASLRTSGGTFTCNGATPVTVANTNLTANSIILVSLKTVGGTVGAIPVPQTVTAGTGFTIAGTASDTSIYNYIILG
jgi:hypothetical protein